MRRAALLTLAAVPCHGVRPPVLLLALAAGGALLAAPPADVARYRLTVTAPTTFTLPGGEAAAGDFCQPAGGAWSALPTERQPGRPVTFTLAPTQCSPAGEALVVLGKPAWMALADTTPPRLTGLTVNGTARPLAGNGVALGGIAGDGAEIAMSLADDENPLAADGIALHLTPDAGNALRLERPGWQPLQRQGQVVLRTNGLRPGAYHGELVVSDLAATVNRAVYSLSFSVFGATIAPDRQSVVLVGAGAEYRLQAHLSDQLLLPGGIWSKLTTRSAGTWLYPRQFTEVTVVRDTPAEKTVLVKANTQDLDGKANEGLGALEYELTVRTDTPALLVTTRSLNIAGKAVDSNASWGWLPAAYYVTPSGRQEWRGKAADKYLDVGRVGWLWLAPVRAGAPGLAWMSHLKFGESRFDTMLLYSETTTAPAGGNVEMRFAVAPAASPEEAAAIYQDLVSRGLLTPPPATAVRETAK